MTLIGSMLSFDYCVYCAFVSLPQKDHVCSTVGTRENSSGLEDAADLHTTVEQYILTLPFVPSIAEEEEGISKSVMTFSTLITVIFTIVSFFPDEFGKGTESNHLWCKIVSQLT